jgi:OOP family OmpA-OmpF porin
MKNKIFIFLAILFAAAALCLPGKASAQMDGETLHISLMGGYLFPNNRSALDNGAVYGLGLGYNFTKNWGIEAFGYYAPSLDDDGFLPNTPAALPSRGRQYSNDVTMARLSGLYHFDTGTNFTPYVSLGVGGNWIARDRPEYRDYSSFAANAGLGFKVFFNEVVALRLEVNDTWSFRKADGARFTAPMVSAGLTFQVGANPACPDSDGDGVCDAYDKCPGTPAGYKVDADGCPLTVSITMDIKFDFDKAAVKNQYLPEVEKVADFLNAHPGSTAVVEGHTDSRGNDAYNQKLSERRAEAVRDTLTTKFGVAAGKVSAVGYGEARPIATNDTAEGRAENRRVVGVFTGTDVDN